LKGLRSARQLLVTGKYADGTVRDLTALVEARVEGDQVALGSGLYLEAVKAGACNVVIQAGSLKVNVPVSVSAGDKPEPISFRNEMIAVLNAGGCNQGACHGTPSGKNGFKLSLRGYDPPADYLHLTHDLLGRRSGRQNPAESLIYLKALGRVAHEGGVRFAQDSLPARIMFAWLAEGSLQDPDTTPTLKKVVVLPSSRVLNEPAHRQQLAVLGHFSDGTVRDVTRLTVFSSSDTSVANVSPHGLVEFYQAGEVARPFCAGIWKRWCPSVSLIWSPNPASAGRIRPKTITSTSTFSPSSRCSTSPRPT
jgi:hypothetical protein